ncbi:MAG: radical SAM protein [Candidatus Nanoarchaeia archaeon]|nr:radical SAM protein [Candidatus Nanoarchaeia archaeon]
MANLFRITSEHPLVGCIAYGIIDRGTNLIQIRPSSSCPLNCIFCSTDSGPFGKRKTNYEVELNHLLAGLKEIAEYKNESLEAYIDSTGEPLTYPYIVDLVKGISKIKNYSTISLQTNGVLLTREKVDELKKAGLDRIDLSINSLIPDKAKLICGASSYDVEKIKDIAEYIAKSGIELVITPVWVPDLNDEDIEPIIQFAKKTIHNKIYPILGIQNFLKHKRGRKPKGVKEKPWKEFYTQLKVLEDKHNVKLILSPEDFGMRKVKSLPITIRKGEKVKVKIFAPGWMPGEMLATANARAITVINCNAKIGSYKEVRIIENANNLYLAR